MNYGSNKTANLSVYINQIAGIASILIMLAIIVAIFAMAPPVAASELDEFETTATTDDSEEESDESEKEKEKEDRKGRRRDNHRQESFFSSLVGEIFEGFFQAVFLIVYDQAKGSFARMGESTDTASTGIDIRETGEPTLPIIQIDSKYLYVNPDISAWDGSLEVGYGAFGFNYRNTYFTERNPSDNLTIAQYHLLLRLSETRSFEWGIGMGSIIMRGNEQNYGFSLTTPIKIYPNESFGIKLKPTYNWINGNYISDFDLAIVLLKRYGSLELGYRFLECNGQNLGGAYVGLAFHY